MRSEWHALFGSDLTLIKITSGGVSYLGMLEKLLRREDSLNTLDKIRALDEQREKILEEAKSAALQKAQDAIRELSELGLRYSLVQEEREPKARSSPTGRSEAKPSPTFDQTLYGS